MPGCLGIVGAISKNSSEVIKQKYINTGREHGSEKSGA